eukprot:750737-Hanusia_phi.AAC.1
MQHMRLMPREPRSLPARAKNVIEKREQKRESDLELVLLPLVILSFLFDLTCNHPSFALSTNLTFSIIFFASSLKRFS